MSPAVTPDTGSVDRSGVRCRRVKTNSTEYADRVSDRTGLILIINLSDVFNAAELPACLLSSAWRAGIFSPPDSLPGFGSASRCRSSTPCHVPSTIATLLTPPLSDPLTAITPRSPDSPCGPRGLGRDTATSSSAPSGWHVWRLGC